MQDVDRTPVAHGPDNAVTKSVNLPGTDACHSQLRAGDVSTGASDGEKIQRRCADSRFPVLASPSIAPAQGAPVQQLPGEVNSLIGQVMLDAQKELAKP